MKFTIDTEDLRVRATLGVMSAKEALEDRSERRRLTKAERLAERARQLAMTEAERVEAKRQAKINELKEELNELTATS